MGIQQKEVLAITTRIFTLLNIFGMLLLQLHYVGLEGQGKIAWINSSIVIFTQYSQWVGGGAVAFLLAKETKSNLLPPAFIWVMIGGILFFSGVNLIQDSPFTYLQWLMIVFLCMQQAIFTVFQNMLLGRNKTQAYHLTILVQTTSTLLLTWLFLWISPEIYSVLMALTLSFSTTFFLCAFLTRKEWFPLKWKEWKQTMKTMLHHGRYVQGANTLLLLLVRTPIYLFPLLYDGGFKEAGMYAILLYFIEGALMFTKSFTVIQFAEICATQESDKALQITRSYYKKSIFWVITLSFLWLFTPCTWLELLINAPICQIQVLSWFLIPGVLFQSISLLILHHFSGTGYFKFNFYNALITFSIGLIGFLFSPHHDIKNILLTLSLSWLIQLFFYLVFMSRWKKLKQIH
jgi:hypothetical protein